MKRPSLDIYIQYVGLPFLPDISKTYLENELPRVLRVVGAFLLQRERHRRWAQGETEKGQVID